jgi:hypothetical protein
MRRRQAERLMRDMRFAAIAPGQHCDRGPEIDHRREMRVPAALEARFEDRAEHGVLADTAVKRLDEFCDERFRDLVR